jgi:hypothetical protein
MIKVWPQVKGRLFQMAIDLDPFRRKQQMRPVGFELFKVHQFMSYE